MLSRIIKRSRRAQKGGQSSMKRGRDLWSLILDQRDEKGLKYPPIPLFSFSISKGEDGNNINEDYTLIFVGDKHSGKTTFINRVHERGKQ
jgi:polynucleotide 5'-kinase involved in rRNA processing